MLLRNKNAQKFLSTVDMSHANFAMNTLPIEQINKGTAELSESSIRTAFNLKDLSVKYILKSSAHNLLRILR